MERRMLPTAAREIRTSAAPVSRVCEAPPAGRFDGDDALTSIQTPKRHIVKEGDKWVLYSKDGKKKLGTFDTKEEALKHEQEVEYFKQKDKEG